MWKLICDLLVEWNTYFIATLVNWKIAVIGRLSKDVGPAPAISKDAEILDDKQSETDKQAVVEKSKHDDTVAGNVGHVLDDINDVKIFKKDYPNSAGTLFLFFLILTYIYTYLIMGFF